MGAHRSMSTPASAKFLQLIRLMVDDKIGLVRIHLLGQPLGLKRLEMPCPGRSLSAPAEEIERVVDQKPFNVQKLDIGILMKLIHLGSLIFLVG